MHLKKNANRTLANSRVSRDHMNLKELSSSEAAFFQSINCKRKDFEKWLIQIGCRSALI